MIAASGWFVTGLSALAANWLTNLVALASLILSLAAFHRGRPRLHVEHRLVFMVANPDVPSKWGGRSVVVITVINDSSRPVILQRVVLELSNGHVLSGEPLGKASDPVLPEFGGKKVWLVDYADVRRAARADAGEEDVSVRAVANSGRRRFRSREVIWVNPIPGKPSGRHRTLQGTLRRWWNNWLVPRVQIEGLTRLDEIDLATQTQILRVCNYGGGIARRVRIELQETESDDKLAQRRVAGVEPIAVPWIRRRSYRTVRVPMTDDEGTFWWVRHKGRAGSGVGAMTLSEAHRLIVEHRPDAVPPA